MGLFRRQANLERHRRPPGAIDRPAPSMSYYSRRSEETLNTGRNLRREAQAQAAKKIAHFWLHRFGLIILLSAALVCLIYIMTLSTNPEVVPVTDVAAGNLIHTPATYQAAAGKLLASSLLNRNKLTIDTNRVSQQLQNEFPELSSVSVTLPLLAHRPVIYIQTSSPAIILNGVSGAYVLGDSGRVLAAAPSAAAFAKLNLPVITDQSGLRLALGRQALTAANVSFAETVVAQLAARQVKVAQMTLPAAASELDVHLAGQPYFVKFNLQSGDARQQAGTFLATQSRLASQHITPSQYIDVRVDGRAYYK